MRITGVEVIPLRIPKRTAFVVAYATRTACLGMLLKVTTDDGLTGWGEAVPVFEVTGENRQEVAKALAEWVGPNLIGMDPFDREEIRLRLERDFPLMPSARCAVDTALWDLRGQSLGLSVRTMLGGARSRHRASMSLGILDAEETVAKASELLSQGFGDLKFKIGLDADADIARIRRVRSELGRDFRLYLDANQGYTVEEAIRVADALADEAVEFMEQPVKAKDLEGLAAVSKRSPITIAADEAVKDAQGLVKLLSAGAARMINVKLMKCGGPSQAELLIRMAEAAGVRAMIGCMIESRVGITAGLSVALGLANVHYIDLDGYLDLSDDVVGKGGVRLDDGYQLLDEGPGLGIQIDEIAVTKYRDEEVIK